MTVRPDIRYDTLITGACELCDQTLGTDEMKKKILIMGLPGAGKTALAKALAPRLNAAHYNADEVRANINKDRVKLGAV